MRTRMMSFDRQKRDRAACSGLPVATCPLPCHEQAMPSSFARHTHPSYILAGEIILPNALRAERGRLTRVANIPLEVSDMQPKDVNLVHLLARCKQRQLDRHNERIERFEKRRCLG
jgi:hypothetical protein